MNEFRTLWKQLAANKQLTATDMAVLALVRAIRKDDPLNQAKFYLSKNFKPISSTTKLANGATRYFALWQSLSNISLYKFGRPFSWTCKSIQWLNEEDLSKIQVLANNHIRGYGQASLE